MRGIWRTSENSGVAGTEEAGFTIVVDERGQEYQF